MSGTAATNQILSGFGGLADPLAEVVIRFRCLYSDFPQQEIIQPSRLIFLFRQGCRNETFWQLLLLSWGVIHCIQAGASEVNQCAFNVARHIFPIFKHVRLAMVLMYIMKPLRARTSRRRSTLGEAQVLLDSFKKALEDPSLPKQTQEEEKYQKHTYWDNH